MTDNVDPATAGVPVVDVQANAAPAGQPPVFYRHPRSGIDTYLDMSDAKDIKTFSKASEGVKHPYDLKPSGLPGFLAAIALKAVSYGWHKVLDVPDNNNVKRHLIHQYAMVSIQNCRDHAMSYFATPTKESQDSVMLYNCLCNSLTAEAYQTVFQSSSKFTLTFTGPPAFTEGSGSTLLRYIVSRAVVDTLASADTIKTKLMNLTSKIDEMDCDIEKFNEYVENQNNALIARGEVSSDLLLHLFKAYETVSDPYFITMIQQTRINHHDQVTTQTVDSIMARTTNIYRYRMDSGEWVSPTNKNDKFVALATEVINSRATQSKPNTGGAAAGKNNKNINRRSRFKEAWKAEAPRKGETTKVVKGKTYHWCKHHSSWTIHNPKDCTLQSGEPNVQSNPSNKRNLNVPDTNSSKRVSFSNDRMQPSAAMHAVEEHDNDDDEFDHEE